MSNERERLARQWAEFALSVPGGSPGSRAAAEHVMATTTEPTMAGAGWDDEKHHLAGAKCDVEGTVISVVMVGETRDGEIYSVDLDEGTGFWPMPCDLTPNGKRYELVEVTDKPENPVEPSTKTMDEYTLSERTDMVGMWAGYNRHRLGGKPTDFVIITGEENEAGRVPCYNPGAPAPHDWAADIWMLTPRFDMPRAWSTDGDPCAPTVSSGENVGADQPEHPETLSTLEDYENAPEGTVVAAAPRYGSMPLPMMKEADGIWVMIKSARGRFNDHMAGTERRVLRKGWGE